MNRQPFTAALALAALVAALLLLLGAAGCGGEDSDDTQAQSTSAPQNDRTAAQQPDDQSPERREQGRSGEGAGSPQGAIADVNPDGENPPTAKQLGITPGADNSLQTFGTDAEGEEREEVVGAMRARFLAQAEKGGPFAAEARKALGSEVLRVGIEGEDAILMLRTTKGALAYYVMRHEDGEWRAGNPIVAPLP